jgi:hypothetical protein
VYFRKDVRVTIQQIGCWDPENKPKMGLPGKPIYVAGPGLVETEMKDTYGLFERTDDWSSCAYFYLDRPTNDLPALLPVAERVAGI